MTTLLSAADGPVSTPLDSSVQGQRQGGPNILREEDTPRQRTSGSDSSRTEGGKCNQDQKTAPPDEDRGAAAKAADRSTTSPGGMHPSRPRPRQSPSSPPPPYLYPHTTTNTVGGAGAGARAGSLRPSVSGILAGNLSGGSSQHGHDRAASLGDRYKGNHSIGLVQHQQHDCSSTKNRVYRSGERYAERSGERGGGAKRSSHQPQRGPSRVGGPCSADSGAIGTNGTGAAVSAAGVETEDRRGGTGASSGRRRGREDGSCIGHEGRGAPAGGKDGEQDQDQQEGQQGNGRVAQIAEGLLWVQKHPVLAAVIWMCGKVLDPGSEDNQQDTAASTGATTTAKAEGASKAGAEGGDGGCDYEDSSDPLPGMRGDFEEGRIVPPGFWRRHSKGRLSWSDDYQGGCLAEYYEDERARMVSEASSVDADASSQQNHHHHQQQASPPASKAGTPGTAAASSCRCSGPRHHAHVHGDPVTAAATTTTSSSAGRGEGGGCKRCSGGAPHDSEGAVQARESAESNAGTARGCVDGVSQFGGKGGREGNEGDNDEDDDDDEVFHSALQLAVGGECGHGDGTEDAEDLAGVLGGCGPRVVQHDTFYGAMQDAMEHEGHGDRGGNTGGREEGAAHGAAPPEDGRVSNSDKQIGETTGIAGSNGAGTPNSAAGAGTWSPQWGWYVTMTPPQDQYPTHHNPIPSVKPPTPGSSADSADTPTSLEGRPPRP